MILSRCCRLLFNNKRQRHGLSIIATRRFHEHNDLETLVGMATIKKTLKIHNINYLEGHACLQTGCPVCDEDKSKDHRIYINKLTGFFICDNCRTYGSWASLEKFLALRKAKASLADIEKFKRSFRKEISYLKQWDDLKSNSQSISALEEEEYAQILADLRLPKVPQSSLTQLNCQYESSVNSLHFPLMSFGGLVAGYKTLRKDSDVEETVAATYTSGILLYKQKGVRTDGSALVVPTVQDLLAVVSQKATHTIVCLPNELKTIPQQVLPNLEAYKRLTLWFNNDEPSWDSARYFAKKFDEKRCHFVRPTDTQPQPKLAAASGYNLKEIVHNAQPIWHKSITTFHSLRQDVLSDLQNIDKVLGVKWKRYPTLNKILGGHRRGEFTILTGPTGCGKTTFMSEYSLDLAQQGVNTLWGSFEIRNSRLARTMLQQMVGVPLENNLSEFDSYADEFEKLPVYFMTFHGQQSIRVVMEAVEHATYVHDIAHVIIDNVQFMMGMGDEAKIIDRFWQQDNIIAAFRSFATRYNCHVTLVIHPRKEREEELTMSSIFGGAKASQEADNILIIQDKRLTSIRGKKYLQVAKNRYSGNLGIMLMEFDKDSLSYGLRKRAKNAKASEERNDDDVDENPP